MLHSRAKPEARSLEGMNLFVKTQHFKDLNFGFVIVGGMASPDATYRMFYGERALWNITMKTVESGKVGTSTSTDKIDYLVAKKLKYRA